MLPTKEERFVESFDIRVIEETGSTNDDLKTLARRSCVGQASRARGKASDAWTRHERPRDGGRPTGCLFLFSSAAFFHDQGASVSRSHCRRHGVCNALRDAGVSYSSNGPMTFGLRAASVAESILRDCEGCCGARRSDCRRRAQS